MEKLQAALEKARKERSAAQMTEAGAQVQRSKPIPALSDVDKNWQNLREFDVPDSVLHERRIVTRTAGSSAAPFDVLRTKVLLQMRQNNWKRLAITSPMPRAGKTTTACNLALGLGRQRDLRAMLLDFDLREPSIHQFFQHEPKHGIGEVLNGQVSFADQAVRLGSNVSVSMARSADSDPTRLLLAAETTSLLDEIEAQYEPDIMIFDVPSMLVNDDTRAFLKNVDCALIVIRANSTRYGHFDTCEREVVEHTNVLGVMLNAYMNTSQDDGS